MRAVSWERVGASAGIVFLLCLPVLWVLAGDQVSLGASAADVQRYQVEQQGAIHLYLTAWFVAMIFLTWFLATLISVLRAAERAPRSLAGVAQLGAALGVVAILLTLMFQAAAAFRPETTPREVTAMLWDLSYLALPVFGVGFVVMLLAIAALAFQTRVLPRWFGVASAVLALLNAVYIAQIATNDGIFLGEIGFMLLVFVWVPVAAAILLLRRSRPAPTPHTPTHSSPPAERQAPATAT